MQFVKVIGQQAVKQRLINMVSNNRISHALLFYEQSGAGGLAMAVAFAQYINCENRTETDSCGACSSCIKIEKLIHPDLHFAVPTASDSKKDKRALTTDYATEWRKCFLENPYLSLTDWFNALRFEANKNLLLSVEESRDIIHKLSFKSFEGDYKICIIWYPETWRKEGSNALLKILEEPPNKTVFILVSENYDELLPTILSRTQLIKIPKVSSADLIAELQLHKVSEEVAHRIVHLSDGSYHKAMALIDEEYATAFDKEFIAWMRLCFNPTKDYPKLMVWIETMAAKKRETLKNFITFCLQTCRECLLINYADVSMVRQDETQFPGLKLFAPFINQNNAEQFSKLLSEAGYHIERNANAKIMFLDLSFKFAKLMKIK